MPAARKHTAVAFVSVALLATLALAGSAGGVQLPGKRDREAPSAPTNVRVTAATPTSVSLAWDASTDNVGVAFYYVYVDAQRDRVSGTTYTATNLACGESVGVWIVAYDHSLNRSSSTAATVSTAACVDMQAPTPPTNFRQAATAEDAVVLAWDSSSDDVGVVGYGVYRDQLPIRSTSEPTVALTGLVCGRTFEYHVDAVDAAGNRSERESAWVQTARCADLPMPSPPSPDATPPTQPPNLVISGVTEATVSLAWSPSADNVGVAGYDVYRNGTKMSSVTSTSSTQGGLACGTSYWFGVEAVDATGNRSARTRVNPTTSPCAPPPSPDTTPPAHPTNLAFGGVTRTSVSLGWSPSTDNVGVARYDVYRNGTKMSSVTSTSSTQGGLACGTSYWFGVEAVDFAGNRSARTRVNPTTSNCPSIPPPSPDTTPPAPPTNLAIGSVTRTSVALTWTPATDTVGVTGYRVYVNGTGVLNPTLPGATVTGLSCGTAFTFEVDAVDAAGNRSTRARVTASTAACADGQAPTVPTNVVASSRAATSIALTWSPSSDNVGVTGYGLYRGGTLVDTSATTTGIFSGLTCNTNYTLAVDARDAAGNRSNKATVMVATTACADTAAPSAPTALAASNITRTTLTLTWNASNDNVGVAGYDVYRNGSKMAYATSTSSNQTGLVCDTSYWFGVEAVDAVGNRSARVNVNATTSPCAAPPPPPPPPPPSGGTTISRFSDASVPWGANLINRWQPVDGNHWSAPGDSGSPFGSGGGMWETATPHGPGFKVVATPEMIVPSGGKMGLIADIDHLVEGAGSTEDWSGMLMLPASGNPNGFPRNFPDWNILLEFHSQSGVPAHIGIDTTEVPYRNHLYFNSMGRKASAPAELVYDKWYSWRIVVKWSYGSDGLFECWLDGQKLSSFTGPTLAPGEIPYLQFGFYSADSLRNEAWHARVTRS